MQILYRESQDLSENLESPENVAILGEQDLKESRAVKELMVYLVYLE